MDSDHPGSPPSNSSSDALPLAPASPTLAPDYDNNGTDTGVLVRGSAHPADMAQDHAVGSVPSSSVSASSSTAIASTTNTSGGAGAADTGTVPVASQARSARTTMVRTAGAQQEPRDWSLQPPGILIPRDHLLGPSRSRYITPRPDFPRLSYLTLAARRSFLGGS